MITAQELDQDFSQHTGAREMRLTSKAAEKPRTTTDQKSEVLVSAKSVWNRRKIAIIAVESRHVIGIT